MPNPEISMFSNIPNTDSNWTTREICICEMLYTVNIKVSDSKSEITKEIID